jgi:hypoxanthine phosphoribosyltransferase
MADIFISYSRPDREHARRMAERLARLDVDVWYDRNLRPAAFWRRDLERELDRAKLVMTLWSQGGTESRWVRHEAGIADEADRLISVRIEPCRIPPPFSEQQAVDLIDWNGDSDAGAWLDLVETIADRLQRGELKEYAIFRRIQKQTPAAADSKRRLRHYTFRDMMALCDQMRDEVRAFDPDVLFSFDSRGGLWAEMFFDYLTYRIPVVIGFRIRNTGPRKGELGFSSYTKLETDRWHLYVPPILALLPRTTKILFVDDYSSTGASCTVFRRYMIDTVGHPPESVKTLTLITSPQAAANGSLPDIHGVIDDAEIVDLFYMFRR